MSRHMTPVMLGLTAFPLAAIGIAAYLVVTMGARVWPVAGVILLLSCCILLAITVVAVKLSRHEEWLWSQQESLRRFAGKIEQALARSAVADKRATADVEALAADVAALRREVSAMLAPQPRGAAPSSFEPQPEAGPARAAEQLTLLLEPVVELSTGTTSHYRAQVGLSDGRGQMVAHDELMAKADQGGMRGALDLRMAKMVAPVLRRLRNRNPGLRVFVPLGRATLASREESDRLIALLQRDGDLAKGMVFEFAQRDLGELDSAGIDNLARLARAGATLALREVYLGGLDLAALRQLGVRYLSFPPHAVDAGSGPSAAWSDFAAEARALKMLLVAGEVKTPQQASAVSRHVRYGHGPFFAPPRKVRPDAGVAPAAAPRHARVA